MKAITRFKCFGSTVDRKAVRPLTPGEKGSPKRSPHLHSPDRLFPKRSRELGDCDRPTNRLEPLEPPIFGARDGKPSTNGSKVSVNNCDDRRGHESKDISDISTISLNAHSRCDEDVEEWISQVDSYSDEYTESESAVDGGKRAQRQHGVAEKEDERNLRQLPEFHGRDMSESMADRIAAWQEGRNLAVFGPQNRLFNVDKHSSMLVEHHVPGRTVKRTKPKAEQGSYGDRYYGWNHAPPVLGGKPMGLAHRQGHYDMVREAYRQLPPTSSAEQFLRHGRRRRDKLVPTHDKDR
jgi:hypothetical protein